ncbi:hypothetical protein CVT26_006172 [Gymnopilus dilepis]|uniref:F-box domain-containing protein n=1 Tax=Gymnopilus dilepis TaxID=231916 RepID=A0A409Y1B3_9AGAR|nr:hypothetical protein CVT26_006172 [Gymnopilus dilepis]
MRILESTPSIRRLSLTSYCEHGAIPWISDHFLQHIGQQLGIGGQQTLLSGLETLELTTSATRIPFSWEAFLDFLRILCSRFLENKKESVDQLGPNCHSRRTLLNICVNLTTGSNVGNRGIIKHDIASRLAVYKQGTFMSLQIQHSESGQDLIEEALSCVVVDDSGSHKSASGPAYSFNERSRSSDLPTAHSPSQYLVSLLQSVHTSMFIEYTFKLQEFRPTTSKVGAQDGICGSCNRIFHLDADIERARHTLETLVEERETVLKEHFNRTHIPILRLPTELNLRIFALFTQEEHDSCVEELFNFASNRSKTHPEEYKRPDFAAPLTLSAVCQRWRAITFAAPTLWTTPIVNIGSEVKLRVQEQLLDKWLDRSADLPLNMTFFCLSDSLASRSVPVISGAVLRVVPRLTKLSLILPNQSCESFLKNLEGAPRLQELRIHLPVQSPKHDTIGWIAPPYLPALIDLRANCSIVLSEAMTFRQHALIVCHSRHLVVEDIVDTLLHAPNLEQGVFSKVRIGFTSSSHLRHEHLKRLEIFSQTTRVMTHLLEVLTLPSLKCLVFNSRGCREPNQIMNSRFEETFASFLHRSQCLLEEIEVTGTSKELTQETLLQTLELIPSLKRLSLACHGDLTSSAWISDEFFQRFNKSLALGGGQIFLPCLDTLNLRIRAKQLSVSWEAFLVFLDVLNSRHLDSQVNINQLDTIRPPRNSHLVITVNLSHGIGKHDIPLHDIIKPDMFSRLAVYQPEGDAFISLHIRHSESGQDLVEEALSLMMTKNLIEVYAKFRLYSSNRRGARCKSKATCPKVVRQLPARDQTRCPLSSSITAIMSISKCTVQLREFHPKDCKIGGNGMCDFCSKIREFDISIQDIQSALEKLMLERDTLLRTQANYTHSPIFRLPTELTLHIFALYIEDEYDSYIEHSEQHSLEPGFRRPKMLDCAPPSNLILVAVCQRWRAIAFATPTLWTRPVVQIYSVDQLWRQEQLLEEWLDRSSDLPLEITILRSADSGLWDARGFTDAVLRVTPRLARLDLNLPWSFCQSFLEGLDSSATLEELRLYPVASDPEYSTARRLQLPHLLALKNLSMNRSWDFKNMTAGLPTLVSCHLRDLRVQDILDALQHAPNLAEGVFVNIYYDLSQTMSLGLIHHRHLKRLTVISQSSDTTIILFEALSLPYLESLILNSTGCSKSRTPMSTLSTFEDVFLTFIHRSQCRLREINLWGSSTDISQAAILKILKSTSTLTRLSLNCPDNLDNGPTWFSNSFFRIFNQDLDMAARRVFLPRIEILEIETRASDLPFSWEVFLAFLSVLNLRSQTDESENYYGRNADHSSDRGRLSVSVRLSRMYNKQAGNIIRPIIASQLAVYQGRNSVSLQIRHKESGQDLIEAALLDHATLSEESVEA